MNIWILMVTAAFLFLAILIVYKPNQKKELVIDDQPAHAEPKIAQVKNVKQKKNPDDIAKRLIKNLEKIQNSGNSIGNIIENLNVVMDCYKSPLLISVLGEFSSGKSTFINAFLKENLLAMKDVETTATITRLQYGEEEKVAIFFKDGTSKEFSLTDRRESIDKYTVENFEDNNILEKTRLVSISLTNNALRHFDLVDTPGYNSPASKRHTELTDKFSKYADVIIWLFDEDQIGKATEVKKLSEICKYYKPIFVINKIDQVILKQNETYEMKFKRALTKLEGTFEKVFFVSSYQALDYSNGGYAKSGMKDVEEYFQNKMIPDAERLKQESLFVKLLELGNDLLTLYNFILQNKLLIDKEISNLKQNEKKLNGLVNKWNDSLYCWSNNCDKYFAPTILLNLKSYFQVSGVPSNIDSKQKVYVKSLQEIENDNSKVDSWYSKLNEEHMDLDRSYNNWLAKYNEYSEKGLGIKSMWDNFWGDNSSMQSGERMELNSENDRYEKKRISFNKEVEKYNRFLKDLDKRNTALNENIVNFLNNTVLPAINKQNKILTDLENLINKDRKDLDSKMNLYDSLCSDLALFENEIKDYYAELCGIMNNSNAANKNIYAGFKETVEQVSRLSTVNQCKLEWSSVYSRNRIVVGEPQNIKSDNSVENSELLLTEERRTQRI